MFTYGQTVTIRETGEAVIITQRHTLSGTYEISDGHGARRWVEAAALREQRSDLPAAESKAAALAVLGTAHHAYKSSPTRQTFRTCLDAIRSCQDAGATTQEIKHAQQG